MNRDKRRNVIKNSGVVFSALMAGCINLTEKSEHKIFLENESDITQLVSFSVFHDNEEVFNDRHELPPSERTEGYNFTNAPERGETTYTIKAVLSDRSVSSFDSIKTEHKTKETLTTNDCYGSAYLIVNRSGKLSSTVAIC